MGTKKRTKTDVYVLEALQAFGDYILKVRHPSKNVNIPKTQVNLEALPKALKALSKEDRENIERFWGLRGGTNHSKKIGHHNLNDRAFIDLFNKAHESLKKLSKLELARMYDYSVDRMIYLVSKKVDKSGISNISDFETIKYLLIFFVVVKNGPKLVFELDPMSFDKDIDKNAYLDEYQALKEMCEQLEKIPDQSINLSLIISLLDMMDLKDRITIQENFGIKSPEIFSQEEIQALKSVGIDTSGIVYSKTIQEIMTFGNVRTFKEKAFKCGAWEVTSDIVLGNSVKLEEFIETIDQICRNKDWISKIEDLKTGEQRKIRTSTGIEILDIYCIGGLEFTDPCEIDFLRTHLSNA